MNCARLLSVTVMIFTLLQSCVSTQLPTSTMWKDVTVELANSPGAVIKDVSIDGDEEIGILISGSLQMTKSRISGGGHVDLIQKINSSASVVASGDHISSRRGNISKRLIPFQVDGQALLNESRTFVLKFHRGSPIQHTNQIGYNWNIDD